MSGSAEPTQSKSPLEQVAALALRELKLRLEDPEEANKLPGTGLLNLVNAAAKALAPTKEKQKDGVEASLAEILKDADLPDDRKHALVEEELARVEAQRQALREALEGDEDFG